MNRTEGASGHALSARGERVLVRPVREQDLLPYQVAVERSRHRLSTWNPVDLSDLRRHLAAQSDVHRTFLVHALEPEGEHDLVAKINVANVVRGRFRSAHLGYDAYDPYAGRGMFREGLALVVSLAFAAAGDGGMGLHRLEANVQPGNVRSAAVLRSLGFRHEGSSARLLWLGGPDGHEDWRDHERYVVTAEEWPARPYARNQRRRLVVLVNGLPGSGRSTLAEGIADELGLPLLAKDAIVDGVGSRLPPDLVAGAAGRGSWLRAGAAESLWSLLRACPRGAVVDSWWPSGSRSSVLAGLRRAEVEPSGIVEVWCEVPVAGARGHVEARAERRHPVHGPQRGLSRRDGPEPAAARPLGVGTVLTVDTSVPLGAEQMVRLALEARASARR